MRGQDAHELEGSGDADPGDLVRRQPGDGLAGKPDFAAMSAGAHPNQIEHRGLARTVRSDQPDQFAFTDIEADIVDGDQPAECLARLSMLRTGALMPLSPRCLERSMPVWRGGGSDTHASMRPVMPSGKQIDDRQERNADNDRLWFGKRAG